MANNWTDSQKQAITVDGSNVLVSAAAGSGKTAVLVERIIEKITNPQTNVSIDRLVVVTFTRAAAAEMKQRIRVALDDLIEKNPKDNNLIRQQTLVNNAKITTIDSFCLDIVRNYFTEIDIDPGFRTADEGEIRLVENDCMAEMLEEYYTDASEEFTDFVEKYGTGRDDSNIEEIILKIYKFARSYPWEDKWYDMCLEMYDSKDALGENKCIAYMWNSARKALRGYLAKYAEYEYVCSLPDGPLAYAGNIEQEKMMIQRLVDADSFEEFAKRLHEVEFGRLKNCGKDADADKKEFVKSGRDELKSYIKSCLKENISPDTEGMKNDIAASEPSVAVMVRLAREFSRRCREQKKERNIIDFNDMEHLALDILVKNDDGKLTYTAVADSLAEYYDEILIDEYQDSNMLQEQILTAVSKNRRETSPNNMYMVGDVKQSIYRFRMACPELFMEKNSRYTPIEEDFDGGEKKSLKIQLQNNFRSRDNVLEAVNRVFERVMTNEYGGIAYDKSARLYHGADYPACPEYILKNDSRLKAVDFGNDTSTEIHLFDKDATELSEPEAEAAVIGDVIRELTGEKDGCVHVVYDKNAAGGYRQIRYSDIVVISRTLQDFAPVIVNSLMNQGIPAYTENSKGFFKVYEVELLLSFLTVIDNPQNDIPMAAVMMSYFGRMTSKDMALIRSTDKRGRLYNVMRNFAEAQNGAAASDDTANEEIKEKVKELLELIVSYRKKSDVMSVYDLIWDVMYSTGFYDFVGTMPAGDRRQANLDILLQRAGDFEKTSYRGLFNFLRYVEKLMTYDVDIGEASVLSEKEDIVRVMSIHKSKGLEFPVCIIAGMGKRLDHKDASGAVLTHQTYGIGTDVVRLSSRTRSTTIIKNAIKMAVREEDTSEFMRLLYVAMTRAREKLIMVGRTPGKAEKSISDWNTMKNRLYGDFAAANTFKTYDYADVDACSNFFDMVMPVALHSDEAIGDDAFVIRLHEQIECDFEENPYSSVENAAKESAVPPYPYELTGAVKSKVTVTELKQQLHDADFEADEMLDEDVRRAAREAQAEEEPDIVPKFYKDADEPLKGNLRGTAYHRIMEILDFKCFDGIDKAAVPEKVTVQLEQMLKSAKITQQQHDCIDARDIAAFIASNAGQRVIRADKAGEVHREQPFVYIDDSIENQLIQGVIDMYFVEDGELVIVDYKTDRVAHGKGEEILKKRYGIQLSYYAKALSQITGIHVKELLIYSFELKKCIKAEQQNFPSALEVVKEV